MRGRWFVVPGVLWACAGPVVGDAVDPVDTDAGGSGVDTDAPADTEVPVDTGPVCTSGTTWRFGSAGAPEMHPGRACFACHTSRPDDGSPRQGVAGTVYTGPHEPDDCYGDAGVTVEIVGADRVVTRFTTDASGNFVSIDPTGIVFPITARVVVGADVREMTTPQATGDCNACHTGAGSGGAPGRIQRP